MGIGVMKKWGINKSRINDSRNNKKGSLIWIFLNKKIKTIAARIKPGNSDNINWLN